MNRFATIGLTISLSMIAVSAQAQVSASDATCRAAIQKATSKLGKTALKVVDGCVKDVLAGKRGTGTNCNDLGVADLKNKIGTGVLKLGPSIAKKCADGPNALALAEFGSCPSPGNLVDDGAPTSGMTRSASCLRARPS